MGGGTSKSLWHTLDRVLVLGNVHYRHTRNLPYSSFEIFIAGGDDIAFVHHHSANEAVIGIGSLVGTCQALEPRVLGHSVVDLISVSSTNASEVEIPTAAQP